MLVVCWPPANSLLAHPWEEANSFRDAIHVHPLHERRPCDGLEIAMERRRAHAGLADQLRKIKRLRGRGMDAPQRLASGHEAPFARLQVWASAKGTSETDTLDHSIAAD